MKQLSGLNPPPPVDGSMDALGVLLHYLRHYDQAFVRARHVVKKRASNVIVFVALANGGIAVLGAAIAHGVSSWFGLGTTALAALMGAVVAWDGLFRHRELWVQRTMILSRIQALRRSIELRRALGEDPSILAREGMDTLDGILREDIETWAEIRRNRVKDQTGDGLTPGLDEPQGP